MTERAAIRAEEGIWSRPAAHLGFREARVSSHHSGVAGNRESMKMESGRESVEELIDTK